MGGLGKLVIAVMQTVLGRRWNNLSIQSSVPRMEVKKRTRMRASLVIISVLMQSPVSRLKFHSVQSAVVLNPCFRITLTQLVSYYLSWVIPGVIPSPLIQQISAFKMLFQSMAFMSAQLSGYVSTGVGKCARNLQQASCRRTSAPLLSFSSVLACALYPKVDHRITGTTRDHRVHPPCQSRIV